jgi:hypothetical protein
LAEVRLLCAVNLDKLDVLVLERGGSLLVLWGESLAVSAPRSEDCRTICQLSVWRRGKGFAHGRTLCEDNVVIGDKLVEVVLLQLYDIGSRGNCRSCEQAESEVLDGMHFCSRRTLKMERYMLVDLLKE